MFRLVNSDGTAGPHARARARALGVFNRRNCDNLAYHDRLSDDDNSKFILACVSLI